MKYIWDLAAVQAIRVTWFDLNVFYCTKYNWDWAHIQKLRPPQATNVSCVKDSGDFIIPIQNELQNLSIHLSGCQSIYSC